MQPGNTQASVFKILELQLNLLTGKLVVYSNIINFNQASRPALDYSGAGFFVGIIKVNSSFLHAKESNFDIMKKNENY